MPNDALSALLDLRLDFRHAATRKKRAALRRLSDAPPTAPNELKTLHDALLFHAAFPDDSTIARLAHDGLIAVARTVAADAHLSQRLRNSGIAGTVCTFDYSLTFAAWLANRFGPDVEIDWRDGSAGESLDEFLHLLAANAERDGLYDDRLSTQEWFHLARSSRRRYASDLALLVDHCNRLCAVSTLREHLFESLGLDIRWRLRRLAASRSFARFAPRRLFAQSAPILKAVNLRTLLDQPLPSQTPLAAAPAIRLLDACRAALGVRGREIDTLTYANPGEVHLLRLDRGIDVAVFGLSPDWRLPVESYFGFMAARNRVPVAYGGGWVLFDRCEIGVNIFEEFRGGESAFTFAQVLRTYRRLFRATRFYVDPFQFGQDNPEAIRSGAFWFYYRLGFRPVDPPLQQLAMDEFARIAARPGYRSPPAVLRRFARGKLRLDLAGRPAASGSSDIDLSPLGLTATRWIGRHFDGDRAAVEAACLRRALKMLGAGRTSGGFDRWPRDEQAWFTRLAPLVVMIERDVRRWPPPLRRRLAEAMRAKGGRRERDYALALAAIAPLHNAWRRIASSQQESTRDSRQSNAR